jgi:hypothetical protein
MTEDLLDEEGVAFCLVEDRVNDRLWRRSSGESTDHRCDTFAIEALDREPFDRPASHHPLERGGQRP